VDEVRVTKRVDFCERSTIAEAWAMVLGPPGTFEGDGAVRTLEFLAKKRFPHLTAEPSLHWFQQALDGAAPFWFIQLKDAAGHRIRLGHRFLSVHFVRDADGARYERYATSLRPVLQEWLVFIASSQMASEFPVERVAFGYVNQVDVPEDGVLADYFKVNVEAELSGVDVLDGLDVRLRSNLPPVMRQVSVSATGAEVGFRLITEVVTERVLDTATTADDDGVLAAIEEVRLAAKDLFFDFATERLMQQMGVHYAAE
jgi:uncharacterized protein (TIGR04255 family)